MKNPVLVLVLVLLLVSSISWGQLSLVDLQGQLRWLGNPWIAGSTGVGSLPLATQQVLQGSLHSLLDRSVPAPLGVLGSRLRAGGTPVSLAWLAGPVRNQGACGSCVAFASVGTLEIAYNALVGQPLYEIDRSEQYILSCGGGSQCSGWTIPPSLDKLTRYGTPNETCSPYREKDSACSYSNVCRNYRNHMVRLTNWQTLPYTYELWIAALDANRPVETSMDTYEDFMSYKSGVYQYVTGKRLGGHAIVIVGYKYYTRTDGTIGLAWQIRNSWGTTWGEAGYGWIAADDRSLGYRGYTVSLQ